MPIDTLQIAVSIAIDVCPDRDLVSKWFQKKSDNYIIAYEYGMKGHLHLQCAMTLRKDIRCNTLKESLFQYLLKNRCITNMKEKYNIRVFTNTRPPMYHFAYCTKEKDYVLYEDDSEIIVSSQLEELWNNYKHIKIELDEKKEEKKNSLLDDIYNGFLQQVRSQNIDEPEQYIQLYLSNALSKLPFGVKIRYFTKSGLEKICELVRLECNLPFNPSINPFESNTTRRHKVLLSSSQTTSSELPYGPGEPELGERKEQEKKN